MSKKLKNMITSEYAGVFEGLSACLVVNYQGVDAETTHEIRGDFAATDPPVTMQVVKNSLVRRALDGDDFEALGGVLDGPSALVYGGPDPVELSRKVMDWVKKVKPLQVQGGFLEGRGTLDAEQVKALSQIPPREVLLGQLASACAGPMRGLAGGLSGIIRKFAYAVNALKEQRGEA